MTATRRAPLLALAMVLAVAHPLAAQRRGPPARAGQDVVERALALRERLALTEDQMAALQVLREEGVQARQEAAATRVRIRSDLAVGEMTREEARAAMQEHRRAARERREMIRTRLEEVLDEHQQQDLRDASRLRGMRRSGIRGHRGMRRGRRMRAAPGRGWRGGA